MYLKLVTGPAEEPVTLTEAKLHCRVDVDDDDSLLEGLIVAARQVVEEISGRALMTQTWRIFLDNWPARSFHVPRPPLQTVNSITYLDQNGVEHTVDAGNYVVDTDSEPGRVALKGASWPSGDLYPLGGVRVEFVAGYGNTAADVPQKFRQAIQLLVGHWYENREEIVVSGAVPKSIPLGVEALLWLDRVKVF